MSEREVRPGQRRSAIVPMAIAGVLGMLLGTVVGSVEGMQLGRDGCMGHVKEERVYAADTLTPGQIQVLTKSESPEQIARVQPGLAEVLGKTGLKGVKVMYYRSPDGQADAMLSQAQALAINLAYQALPPVYSSVTATTFPPLLKQSALTLQVFRYAC